MYTEIFREFLKYGRKYRLYFVLLVVWQLFTTWTAATHQVFVSDSESWRDLAWHLETLAMPITLLGVLAIMAILWDEDSLWRPNAFWHTRPLGAAHTVAAKSLWLLWLGGVIPFASAFLITWTAQLSLAEAFLRGLWESCLFLMLGALVSVLVLLSRHWQEVAGLVALYLIAFVLLFVFWQSLGGLGIWDVGCFLILLSGSVSAAWWALRDGNRLRAHQVLVWVHLAMVLVLAVTVTVDTRLRQEGREVEGVTVAVLRSDDPDTMLQPGLKVGGSHETWSGRHLFLWLQPRILAGQSRHRLVVKAQGRNWASTRGWHSWKRRYLARIQIGKDDTGKGIILLEPRGAKR